ncbi:MAG TPA: response regulator [Anaeromyxobacteraceae bacterium]|nr:response regulator [Anaeromyxobacteraceae bacterium]
MGDYSRMLVADGVLSADDAARVAKAAPNGDIASAVLELRLASESDLVRTLARALECPGVDLSGSAIAAKNLLVVAPAFCRSHRLLPVSVGRSDVVLAMANPDDLAAADEVRFLTGKKVLRYAAVAAAIARALDGLEQARRDGVSIWRGERVPQGAPAAERIMVVKPTDPTEGVELPDVSGTMELVGLSELLAPFQPPSPPPPTPPRPTSAAPSFPTTLRLDGVAAGKVALVADDDAEVRQLLATVLRKVGCAVLEANDGQQALDMVREARPDLVVLDAMMPGKHGFDVCRIIKADRELRPTRVILCSAIYRGTAGADARVAFGADAFIEKPFRLDELTRIFKVALVGTTAAESPEERSSRLEAQALWRAASEAIAMGRFVQAAELARDATGKDPWSAEGHYYLGQALSRQGLLFEAVAAYDRAAELRPDVDASHQCLAQTYEQLGFQKSARESWTRAIEACKDPVRRRAMQVQLMKLLA